MTIFDHHTNHDKKPLNIIIVGCGKVGKTLVEQLNQEGNEITVIDQKANQVEEITNLYDVMGLVGNGASYSIQKEAGIDNADLLIAVTDSDELNLLCCTVAKRVANCSAIARVRTPDYSEEVNYLREKLGLAMIINPEMESAREIARLFYLPSALEVNTFAHGQAELIKYRVPTDSVLDGKTLMEFSSSIHEKEKKVLIVAIERSGKVTIPNGDFRILAGDMVTFVLPRRNRRDFLKELHLKSSPVKNCMIIGGGKSSYYLAKQLVHMGIEVKIIERDPSRCEQLSIDLPGAIIINGDGTDEALLKEEGLETTDSFVSLTGIDEQNVFLTLHARQVSNAKVITKINRVNFKDVINSMDLGSVIYPRYITAEAIIAYARAMRASIECNNIETLYHMYDHQVEAIEFNVDKESQVTGIPLKDLKTKEGLTISFINRDGNIIIPDGNDIVTVGDTVMVVTTNTGFNDLDDILAE